MFGQIGCQRNAKKAAATGNYDGAAIGILVHGLGNDCGDGASLLCQPQTAVERNRSTGANIRR